MEISRKNLTSYAEMGSSANSFNKSFPELSADPWVGVWVQNPRSIKPYFDRNRKRRAEGAEGSSTTKDELFASHFTSAEKPPG